MRFLLFIIFIVFVSCQKKTAHDQVKFDFYKKNAKVIFKISNTELPSYKSDLEIELLDSINEYNCFYGTFYNRNQALNGFSLETVNTLCYDDKMNIINWFTGDVNTNFIHDSFRIKKDKFFEKLLLEKETNQFLSKYKPK